MTGLIGILTAISLFCPPYRLEKDDHTSAPYCVAKVWKCIDKARSEYRTKVKTCITLTGGGGGGAGWPGSQPQVDTRKSRFCQDEKNPEPINYEKCFR